MSHWKIRPQAYGMMLRMMRHQRCPCDIARRLRWLQYASVHGIALTCRHFGISRSTFIRWAKRFDPQNPIDSLTDLAKSPHTVRAPETDPRTLKIIRELRKKQPHLGKNPLTLLLQTQYDITLAPATVGRIIRRHGLYFADTESHRSKRNHVSTEHTKQFAESDDFSGSTRADPIFLVPEITT